jgi:CubicO group peptidase (beta-lactamase class C family)
LKPAIKNLVNRFTTPKTVAIHFANVNTLTQFDSLKNAGALMTAYQDGISQQEAAAEIVFGAIPATGKLPVSLNANYKQGMGLTTTSLARLQYNLLPEAVGISSDYLNAKVDSMAKLAIAVKGAPGVVVLIAKEGKVIYHKAFGNQIYETTVPLKTSDIFDLASITKISTSVPALMKWQDEGKFSLKTTMGQLIPSFAKSNKSGLLYEDVLTHKRV